MDPAERLQLVIGETLHADGKPVDPGLAVTGKALCIGTAGIALHRDLDGRVEIEAGPQLRHQLLDRRVGKQRRGATTDEDTGYLASPNQWQVLHQVLNQGLHVGVFIEFIGLV